MSDFDITIIGGGIVGTTTALALAKTTTLKIALIESNGLAPIPTPEGQAAKVSAISLTSEHILRNLDCWEMIVAKNKSAPYRKVMVWDENGHGQLHFDSQTIRRPYLGHIIEDWAVLSSLQARLKEQANVEIFCPFNLKEIKPEADLVKLYGTNTLIKTKWALAADGARSWVRQALNFPLKHWDYQQTAIVATVETEFSHQATAWQRFLSSGPLAFLPLASAHHSSIVWSVANNELDALLNLKDHEFKEKLCHAFDRRLGKIIQISARRHFPLQMYHAKNYIKDRTILLGDAAHTIHPLVGQGVNLGLLDAVCIVDRVQNKGIQISAFRQYERWRKAETTTMVWFIEAIKHLFSNKTRPVQWARNCGMQAINSLPLLKNFFAQYAIGERDHLPQLACYREKE